MHGRVFVMSLLAHPATTELDLIIVAQPANSLSLIFTTMPTVVPAQRISNFLILKTPVTDFIQIFPEDLIIFPVPTGCHAHSESNWWVDSALVALVVLFVIRAGTDAFSGGVL